MSDWVEEFIVGTLLLAGGVALGVLLTRKTVPTEIKTILDDIEVEIVPIEGVVYGKRFVPVPSRWNVTLFDVLPHSRWRTSISRNVTILGVEDADFEDTDGKSNDSKELILIIGYNVTKERYFITTSAPFKTTMRVYYQGTPIYDSSVDGLGYKTTYLPLQ